MRLCTLPNKSHFPGERPWLITSCEIAEALQSAAQLFKIAQMQEEGELSNELLVKTNPHDFSDCEAASPISGLGNLACSISRKAETPSAEAFTFGVQSRRAEEMILARTTLVAINARPEVDTLPRTAFRASIADPLTSAFAIVNAIASQGANMQFRSARKTATLKKFTIHTEYPPTID